MLAEGARDAADLVCTRALACHGISDTSRRADAIVKLGEELERVRLADIREGAGADVAPNTSKAELAMSSSERLQNVRSCPARFFVHLLGIACQLVHDCVCTICTPDPACMSMRCVRMLARATRL